MPLQADRPFFNGQPRFIERELFAELPNPNGGGVQLGDRAYVRSTNIKYTAVATDTPNNLLIWSPDGGGGGASMWLYVVAEAGTPQAVPGTFPSPFAAITQAVADYGALGQPLAANIELLPGPSGYPGCPIPSGAHLFALSGGVRFTSGVSIAAAGGWTAGAARASVRGVRFEVGAGSALTVAADVTAGELTFEACEQITTGTAMTDASAVAGLTIRLKGGSIAAGTAAWSLSGAVVRAQDADISGVMPGAAPQCFQLDRCAVSNGRIELAGATATGLVRYSSLGDSLAAGVARLNNGALLSLDNCTISSTAAVQVLSTAGIGSLVLLSGSTPGLSAVSSSVAVSSRTSGKSFSVPSAGVNVDGYLAPAASAVFAMPLDAELLVVDCSAAANGSVVEIELPDAKLAVAWSLRRIIRLDSNLGVTLVVRAIAPNSLNTVAGGEVTIGAARSFRVIASREPSGGSGRWITD